jgi:serine/threonine protein kinase
MEIKLVVEKGVHCGLELVKTEAGIYHIGRSPEADLALMQDEYISREHCQIEFSAKGALLQHGEGRSGTFVNSKPMRKAFLADGDAIVVGRSLVRVHLSGVDASFETIKPSPASIQGFELVKPLPSDGPGETWWAASEASDQMVTLHILRMDFQDEKATQRFLRESETCVRLRHPGLLRFWKQGFKGNMLWFATDLAEGNTLEQYIVSQGPLNARRAVILLQQVMDIMTYLHQEGIVHRTLRPASLRVRLRGEPELQLTDLGCAKCFHTEELQRVTHTGECGFPIHPYTAPESLVDFRSLDPRIDIYALGCLLYFVLTGHHPYQSPQNQDLVLEILETAPAPLLTLKPDLPPSIVQFVEKAMARDPGKRYSTVPAMHQALNPDNVDPIESLQRQLANARENYRLIEERESEYVEKPPLDLVKKKKQLEKMIVDLEARIEIAQQPQDAKHD